MKQADYAGGAIRFVSPDEKIKRKENRFFAFIPGALLYLGAAGIFFDMTDTGSYIWLIFAGLISAAVECLLKESGKKRHILHIGLPAGVLAVILIRLTAMQESFGLLANRMFSESEAVQLYEYRMFQMAPADASDPSVMIPAIVLLLLLGGLLCGYMSCAKRLWPLIVMGALAVFCECYYGVFPHPVWNIAFAAALFFAGSWIVYGERKDCVPVRGLLLLLVAAAAAGVILFGAMQIVSPERNEQMYQASEHVRDLMDEKVENRIYGAMDPSEEDAGNSDGQNANPESGDTSLQKESAEAENTASLAKREHNWALIVLAVIIVAVLVWLISLLIRRHRAAAARNAKINSSDKNIAANAVFCYLADWFFAFGVPKQNRLFSSYRTVFNKVLPGISKHYDRAVEIWQKAVYSGHTITDEELAFLKKLLGKTQEKLTKKATMRQKLRIRYRYFL